MSWRQDVIAVVERLPSTFRLADAYRFIPELHRKHPENRHVAEKIRQQLQVLRDEGEIRFGAEAGVYHRVASGGPVLVDELPLHVGEETTRAELAEHLGMKSADPLRRGMFRRADGPYRQHLFLFHDEQDNPYGDVVEGDRIHYVGQGMRHDQGLSGYNKYLHDHLDLGVRVHYFTQPAGRSGVVVYEGQVVCEGARRVFRPDEGRSVIVFDLVKAEAEAALSAYGSAYDEMLGREELPPALEDRPRRLAASQVLVRDRAFRSLVVGAYEGRCAVCGDPIVAPTTNELQAAHIVGVAERGPDEVRNGVSLCVRHHWAFDHGVFTLSDDHRVVLLAEDPHGELVSQERIGLPRVDALRPASYFLEFHRAKWAAA